MQPARQDVDSRARALKGLRRYRQRSQAEVCEPEKILREHAIGLIWGAWRSRKSGVGAIAQRQRARLAEMVAFARAHSPYYHELYRDLPDRVEDPALLPVTDKKFWRDVRSWADLPRRRCSLALTSSSWDNALIRAL